MLKNFRLQVAIRVMLLGLAMALCIILWFETKLYLSAVLLSLLVIYQIVRLVHFVELTNRKLRRFLNSIRYSDFSRSFSGSQKGASYRQLDEAFAQVVEAFKKQRIEKQVQFRYMQTIVQHIGIGLISFKKDGEIELINTAAKRLLGVATLRNVRNLDAVSPALADAITKLHKKERDTVRISINNTILQLALHATVFWLQDERYTLVSFQDIHAQLEDKEMEAWQNLTEVMTHEIMNSVTPIASLSDTVQMLLKANTTPKKDAYLINPQTVHDLEEALATIGNRSRGLIKFVDSYRDFTKVPEPETQLFSVKKLLHHVQNLNKGEAAAQHINIRISVEPQSLEITADLNLIEQVLINLIKNAFRALKNRPGGTITLRGNIAKGGNTCLYVHDDGPGIAGENLDKIFIPFYSTNPAYKGGSSGIGLSLSRQIMRAHGGTISVESTRKTGTTFRLQF